LILSTDFSETSLVVRRNERNIKIVYWFSCKVPVSGQIFEKSSNIKFYQNPSSGSQVVPCGQTDRPTKLTYAKAPKILRQKASSRELGAKD